MHSQFTLLFLLVAFTVHIHCEETSLVDAMKRGYMRSRFHNLKQSHAEALRFQHEALASQTVPAPEGYVVQAYLPSGLTLESERFSPSLAFPQGTSFAMVMHEHRGGSIRSLSSSWSIILDQIPLCAETLPSFMEKGMISTVPPTMALYLFEGPSFTGQCRRVQVPPKESFLIGSLVMVPMTPHHIATFFTQENYSGCEIGLGEWTNNTTPRIGGIRSMHLYQPLVLTSYDGIKRLFMAGDYPSVKMYGTVHMLSLPLDGDRGTLLCQENGACFSLLKDDSDMALTMPFDTYDIPAHMAVEITMPTGTIVLYGKGTLDSYLKERTVDASLAYIPKPTNIPSICSAHQCFSVGETPKMQLNVPITQLSVPKGWSVKISFTLSSGEYVYGPGVHDIKCMLTCTIRTITIRRV